MAKEIKTFLWFATGAEQATRFYTSLFNNSAITAVHHFPVDHEESGEVLTIDFTLDGAEFVAMQATGGPKPNEAFSFSVSCTNQAEIDRLWDALVEGGEPIQCGWLRDKFGFCWQLVPKRHYELLEAGTPAQREALMGAMMKMVKFDIAGLESAYHAAG